VEQRDPKGLYKKARAGEIKGEWDCLDFPGCM
jgi:adenylylsulfate kinase-like enzyme